MPITEVLYKERLCYQLFHKKGRVSEAAGRNRVSTQNVQGCRLVIITTYLQPYNRGVLKGDYDHVNAKITTL